MVDVQSGDADAIAPRRDPFSTRQHRAGDGQASIRQRGSELEFSSATLGAGPDSAEQWPEPTSMAHAPEVKPNAGTVQGYDGRGCASDRALSLFEQRLDDAGLEQPRGFERVLELAVQPRDQRAPFDSEEGWVLVDCVHRFLFVDGTTPHRWGAVQSQRERYATARNFSFRGAPFRCVEIPCLSRLKPIGS